MIPFALDFDSVPFVWAACIANNARAFNAECVADYLKCFGIAFTNAISVAENAVCIPVVFVYAVPYCAEVII